MSPSFGVGIDHEVRVHGYHVVYSLADSDRHFFRARVTFPDGETVSECTIAPQDSLYPREGQPEIPSEDAEAIERALWDEIG